MKFFDNFKTKFHNYYDGQRAWPRYVFMFLVLCFFVLLFVGNQRNYATPIETTHYDELYFVNSELPLDGKYFFNQEKIDRELAIARLNTDQFVMIHKREPRYLPYITEQLLKNDLPSDLKYIPVIESALRIDAVSSAGAAGLRQFMPATAEKYGLIVNDEIDERYDLEKSTQAAIDYFIDLYRKFEDRNLVVAAYNRGENGLLRDMQSQSQSGYYDLRLNTETSRYVFRLIANKYLMEHRYEFFDSEILGEQYSEPKTKEIKVSEISDLKERGLAKGYSYTEIRQLNPRIRGNSLPEGDWKIRVFK